MSLDLNAQRARIFRITHINNVPWILANGLHCRNSNSHDPKFTTIGNVELIDRRSSRVVPVKPGGSLSDYVPFYFTPHSPMLLNIKTGWGGITTRKNEDIVIIVSNLKRLNENNVRFVFTDRHAYLNSAQFFTDKADLTNIDWKILDNRDFKGDANDPGKKERYQAEALPHQHVPTSALAGIVCYNDKAQGEVQKMIEVAKVQMDTVVRPTWYF